MDARQTLSPDEVQRYSRHLLIPEIGREGQLRLKGSAVLIVGAGGLGSPASTYLAAAGVGKLGLVDFDTVDLSNLQRQVLHNTAGLGQSKVESAATRLQEINPEIEIETYDMAFDSSNALEIAKNYDLIVDGTDNFATRYLISDLGVKLGIPHVFASVYRFDGQASVFDSANGGPCYRCVFPVPPEPGTVPNCAEGGVLGVLPGILGSIQASEAIKSLLGIGESMAGKLLLFNALEMSFDTLNVRKNPNCKVCSLPPDQIELIDYEAFCGETIVENIDENLQANEWEIDVKQLAAELSQGNDVFLLDVRELPETQISSLENSFLIPLGELPMRKDELDPEKNIVVYCRSGVRSDQAMRYLRVAGFKQVRNLLGGINEWARSVDNNLPVY
jgi:adenylyltransferase/sulfurtransferase